MHAGTDFGTAEHRARGRGRKAFWLIVVAAAVAAIVYLT